MQVSLPELAKIIASASEADIRNDISLGGRLTLHNTPPISISFAPFDHIQTTAKAVIVGITPGLQQATNSLLAFRNEYLSTRDLSASLAAAKVFASFSGPMRSNLVEMLDFIGLNRAIGVSSTSTLWNENSRLVHFTSALRYPVFVGGKNYSGQPRISSVQQFTHMLETCLAREARLLSAAAWIPLGPVATEAVNWLIKKRLLSESNILSGLPHPSGANAERIAYFVGRKEKSTLSAKTNPVTLDSAREHLLNRVATFNS